MSRTETLVGGWKATLSGAELRAYLDRFWPRALAAFRTEVERPTTTQENP